MQVKWLNQYQPHYEKVFFVGDIGGTNTNLAIAGEFEGKIDLFVEVVFDSHAVTKFTDCVVRTVQIAQEKYPKLNIDLCCVSGAGIVSNNVCTMTNQSWIIDGNDIEKTLGVKTLIINDFTAISYGLPLLDIDDPEQIEVLKRPDGSVPQGQGELRAVAGAGTGLGVGFITKLNGTYVAFPSEGGHMDLADMDEDTRGFRDFVQNSIDIVPEYEMAVSGQGIKNLFYFFLEKGVLDKNDAVVTEILRTPDLGKPALVSKNAAVHSGCLRIMETFVKFYARFVSNVSSFLIPKAGFYLAGGISGKNLEYFTKDHLFVRTFEQHCNPNIHKLLKEIPIFVVKDYSISLYGAANAARSLMV